MSPVELREIIDAVNSPMVGACLDAARLERFGSLTDWMAILHRRARAIRLTVRDVNTHEHRSRLRHASELDRVMAVLQRTAFDGVVILSESITAETLGALRKQLQSSDRHPDRFR
jgi:sugar phosphate isomerase/epimerase